MSDEFSCSWCWTPFVCIVFGFLAFEFMQYCGFLLLSTAFEFWRFVYRWWTRQAPNPVILIILKLNWSITFYIFVTNTFVIWQLWRIIDAQLPIKNKKSVHFATFHNFRCLNLPGSVITNPSSVFLSTFKFYYGFKHEWTK